jgi:hypothetical protein
VKGPEGELGGIRLVILAFFGPVSLNPPRTSGGLIRRRPGLQGRLARLQRPARDAPRMRTHITSETARNDVATGRRPLTQANNSRSPNSRDGPSGARLCRCFPTMSPSRCRDASRRGHIRASATPLRLADRRLGGLRQTETVRKQYHFWPDDHGLDAWDVNRLIELSAPLPVDEVAHRAARLQQSSGQGQL